MATDVTQDPDRVTLRPIIESDLAQLERLDADPALSEPFEWRGYRDPRLRRQRWERDGYLGERDSMLAVVVDSDSFAGIVTWRSVAPSGRPGCLEVGILLFPEHRGSGIGTAAQVVLADYLFMTTTANRLEATTEVDNIAERKALTRAGFVEEGVLRGRGFVRGEWRDGVMYSRLRSDPAS